MLKLPFVLVCISLFCWPLLSSWLFSKCSCFHLFIHSCFADEWGDGKPVSLKTVLVIHCLSAAQYLTITLPQDKLTKRYCINSRLTEVIHFLGTFILLWTRARLEREKETQRFTLTLTSMANLASSVNLACLLTGLWTVGETHRGRTCKQILKKKPISVSWSLKHRTFLSWEDCVTEINPSNIAPVVSEVRGFSSLFRLYQSRFAWFCILNLGETPHFHPLPETSSFSLSLN